MPLSRAKSYFIGNQERMIDDLQKQLYDTHPIDEVIKYYETYMKKSAVLWNGKHMSMPLFLEDAWERGRRPGREPQKIGAFVHVAWPAANDWRESTLIIYERNPRHTRTFAQVRDCSPCRVREIRRNLVAHGRRLALVAPHGQLVLGFHKEQVEEHFGVVVLERRDRSEE